MLYNVLIAGAGQLGSRYLQGLAKCTIPLSIYIADISPESLALAQSRWMEVGGDKTFHTLQSLNGLDNLPAEIDLGIIATTASVRTDVVKQLAGNSNIKNWLLEKILAQSEAQIKNIEFYIGHAAQAWVNTPYRAMEWYQKIRSEMVFNGTFDCELTGGKTFGLASNAIHYLDLLVWLSGETITEIKTDDLDMQWFKSKRDGFWDIFGSLKISFSNGSKAFMRGETYEPSKTIINIKTGVQDWRILASEGLAICNNEHTIPGREEFQSDITAPIIESILLTGTCQLPLLKESTAIHIPLISAFLTHWNKHMPEQVTEVPIT